MICYNNELFYSSDASKSIERKKESITIVHKKKKNISHRLPDIYSIFTFKMILKTVEYIIYPC